MGTEASATSRSTLEYTNVLLITLCGCEKWFDHAGEPEDEVVAPKAGGGSRLFILYKKWKSGVGQYEAVYREAPDDYDPLS